MTAKSDTARILAKRDSATALLRKIGVAPSDYNLFIDQLSNGTYVCHVDQARQHLAAKAAEEAKAKAKARKPRAPKERKPKTPKEPKAPRASLSNEIRTMIVDGMTNDEIWAVLKEKYGFGDNKRHYPAWYRGEMRRKAKAAPAESAE